MIPLSDATRTPGSEPGEAFSRVCTLLALLRSPDGCPWDRAQTLTSLRSAVLEEASELVDAITSGDINHVLEELGDVYLVVGLLGQILAEASESRGPTAVLNLLAEKLIRRHPHVFAEDGHALSSAGAVVQQWDQIKADVEGRSRGAVSVLDRVAKHLSPLPRAHELQKKAAKAGFDWPDATGPRDKLLEEIAELEAADSVAEREHEIGDLLFSVVNYARHSGVDPVLALQAANSRFERRFREMEREAGSTFSSLSLEEQEALWQGAKAREHRDRSPQE